MTVQVMYGLKPDNESERTAAVKLADGLERSDEHFVILCNVNIPGSNRRADFVVLATRAIFVVELKHCDSPLLVPSDRNKPWRKLGRDGSWQSIERSDPGLNVYQQLHGYVLGMRDWLRSHGIAAVASDKHRDVIEYYPRGVVAIEPQLRLHPDSEIEKDQHYKVVGLNELAQFIEQHNVNTPRSRIGLTRDECSRLAEHLGCREWHSLYSNMSRYRINQKAELDDLGKRGFVGREDVLAEIAGFLSQEDHGTLVLEGPPGAGKSSLMAKLVRDCDYSYHIVRKYGVASQPLRVIQSLLAQLCIKYELDLTVPEDPSVLQQRLDDALVRASGILQDRGSDAKEVLIIDGMDELEQSGSSSLNLLPESLPSGVYAILSGRPGTNWGILEHRISRRLMLPPLDKRETMQLLHAHGQEPSESELEQAFRRSQGNPLYLTLLAGDATEQSGLGAVLEVAPGGFRDVLYQRLDEACPAGSLSRDLAITFAIAREPMSHNQMAVLAGQSVHKVGRALVPLRQLLSSRGRGEEFFHSVIREYVLGEMAGELDIKQRHLRIAECCDLASPDWQAYGLHHKLDHLKSAGERKRVVDAVTSDLVRRRREAGVDRLSVLRDIETAFESAVELGECGLPDVVRLSLLKSQEMNIVQGLPEDAIVALARLDRVDEALDYARRRLEPNSYRRVVARVADILLLRSRDRATELLDDLGEAPDLTQLSASGQLGDGHNRPTAGLAAALTYVHRALARSGETGYWLSIDGDALGRTIPGILLATATAVPIDAPGATHLIDRAAAIVRDDCADPDDDEPDDTISRLIRKMESDTRPFGVGDSRGRLHWAEDSLSVSYGKADNLRLLFPSGVSLSPVIGTLRRSDPKNPVIETWVNRVYHGALVLPADRSMAVVASALALAPFDEASASALIARACEGVLSTDANRDDEVQSDLWNNVRLLRPEDVETLRSFLLMSFR